jgi:hypothetical protein
MFTAARAWLHQASPRQGPDGEGDAKDPRRGKLA